jgi:hypothetical protein
MSTVVRRFVMALLAAALLGGVGILIWLVPPALYEETRLTPRSPGEAQLEAARLQAIATTRTAFVAGLAGLAALGGLWVSARNTQINQRTLEETGRAQADAVNLQTRALVLQTDGLVTDRYSKAIEQLGATDDQQLSVRLGAIYSLQRIARASKEDQPSIVAVLSAFVQHRGKPPESPDPADLDAHRASPDAQAAAQVVGGLPRLDVRENIDWTGAHLERASLGSLDLSGAYLGWTHMQRAYLNGSRCRGTIFDHADLRRAFLREADLREAKFVFARLEGARLYGAILTEADLRGAQLAGASLAKADLTSADLRGTDMSKVQGLMPEQLTGVRMDENTRLPAELQSFIP